MAKAKKQLPAARSDKLSPFGKFKMSAPNEKTGKPNDYKKSAFAGFGK